MKIDIYTPFEFLQIQLCIPVLIMQKQSLERNTHKFSYWVENEKILPSKK